MARQLPKERLGVTTLDNPTLWEPLLVRTMVLTGRLRNFGRRLAWLKICGGILLEKTSWGMTERPLTCQHQDPESNLGVL